MATPETLRSPKDAAHAREIYAMGFAPALDAGYSPYAALEMVRADNAAKLDERAVEKSGALFVGKIVSDGKLGRIVEIDGSRVKLVGYFDRIRWAHIGSLSDWSFRDEPAES